MRFNYTDVIILLMDKIEHNNYFVAFTQKILSAYVTPSQVMVTYTFETKWVIVTYFKLLYTMLCMCPMTFITEKHFFPLFL